MTERTALGRRIAAACAIKGISMTTLAERVGIARNTMTRIVTGDTESPASGIMVKIARELDVSLDYLLDVKGEEQEPTTDSEQLTTVAS